jgi:hypothetical protein
MTSKNKFSHQCAYLYSTHSLLSVWSLCFTLLCMTWRTSHTCVCLSSASRDRRFSLFIGFLLTCFIISTLVSRYKSVFRSKFQWLLLSTFFFHFVTHRHLSICRCVAYVADKAVLNKATIGQGLLPCKCLDFGLCQFHLSSANPFCEGTRLFHKRNSLCAVSGC